MNKIILAALLLLAAGVVLATDDHDKPCDHPFSVTSECIGTVLTQGQNGQDDEDGKDGLQGEPGKAEPQGKQDIHLIQGI